MDRSTVARLVFGLTALTVLVGLVIQLGVVIDRDEEQFRTIPGRVFNMFCFFTVQSNLIVGVTCLLLAIRLTRTSTVFRLFRLAGVVDIAITGIVYHVALADLRELDGQAAVADQLLHVVVPIAAVAGWVVFGPRGLVTWSGIWLAALVPTAWVVFTLIRGPIVDWYPYPFMDVRAHGYPRVLLNLTLVAVLFVAMAAGAAVLDRWLARREPHPKAPRPLSR